MQPHAGSPPKGIELKNGSDCGLAQSLKSGVNMLDHPNARTCWPKVRLDHTEIHTVFVIETDLALLPDDPDYDHEAFSIRRNH
jgi:hypothetical protein